MKAAFDPEAIAAEWLSRTALKAPDLTVAIAAQYDLAQLLTDVTCGEFERGWAEADAHAHRSQPGGDEHAFDAEEYAASVAANSSESPKGSCRRCSDCRGENHHWLEECRPPPPDGTGFNGYVCKHCDALAEMCDECNGPVEPGHVCEIDDDDRGTCRACGGTGVIDDGSDFSHDCSMCAGTGDHEACLACEIGSLGDGALDPSHTCATPHKSVEQKEK